MLARRLYGAHPGGRVAPTLEDVDRVTPRRLTEAGNTGAAIAILEMNGEFDPASADIDVLVGDQYPRPWRP